MKTLMKKDRNVLPAFRNLLEDFWGADRFFENDWLHFPTSKVPAVNIKSNDGDYEIEVVTLQLIMRFIWEPVWRECETFGLFFVFLSIVGQKCAKSEHLRVLRLISQLIM